MNCSESLTILRELDDFSNAKTERAPEPIQTKLNVSLQKNGKRAKTMDRRKPVEPKNINKRI